jgi:hypothetical protein
VNISNEGEGTFGPGPYSAGEIRILYLLLEIKEKIGKMENATGNLGTIDQRLLEVIVAANKAATLLPGIQNTLTEHNKDLNGLGKRVDFAITVGKVAVAIAALIPTIVFIYHAVERLLSPLPLPK